jgi:hypothetical protein
MIRHRGEFPQRLGLRRQSEAPSTFHSAGAVHDDLWPTHPQRDVHTPITSWWQTQCDTAFVRTTRVRNFHAPRALKSAVDAPLCRRSPWTIPATRRAGIVDCGGKTQCDTAFVRTTRVRNFHAPRALKSAVDAPLCRRSPHPHSQAVPNCIDSRACFGYRRPTHRLRSRSPLRTSAFKGRKLCTTPRSA